MRNLEIESAPTRSQDSELLDLINGLIDPTSAVATRVDESVAGTLSPVARPRSGRRRDESSYVTARTR